MRAVGVLEAKTKFSALVADAEGGEEIVITRHGRAVARLTGLQEPPRRRRLSGPELVARFDAVSKKIAEESPELQKMNWEELKVLARR